MSNALVMPDAEAIVRTAIAPVFSGRAYSSVPNSPVWPIAVVSRAGGTPAVRVYMDAARIQVDVWGGAKGDATPVPKSTIHDLTQQARVAILNLEGTKMTSPVGAWISGVDDAQGVQWLPDQETGRDRYLFEMFVWARTLLPGE